VANSRPSIQAQLDQEVVNLDRLLADVRGGIRGPHHFDEREARADAIGRRLRAAFRERWRK